MSDFFLKHRLILSEVFSYIERGKNLEKKVHNSAKRKSSSYEGLTVETRFLDVEKSSSKRLFSDDSKYKTITRGQLISIKPDNNRAKF